MSSRQIEGALNHGVPRPAERQWGQVATLRADDGQILVFDPWYHDPAVADNDHTYDLLLHGPAGDAEIHMELLHSAIGVTISGVRIVWEPFDSTDPDVVGSVGVDSGLLAIARYADSATMYRRGGPESQSSLWVPFGPDRVQRARRAASVLSNEGFSFEQKEDGLYVFAPPLSEEALIRARTALVNVGSDAIVNVSYPQTVYDLKQGLQESFFVSLYDQADPFLVGFCPGYGDSTYEWHVLRRGSRLAGFECVMVDLEEDD